MKRTLASVGPVRIDQHNSVYIILVLMLVLSVFYMPQFLAPTRLLGMLRHASALGILTLGHLFVIMGGGVDLSVAATLQMSVVIYVYAFNVYGIAGLIVGIILAFVLGAVMGLVNGVIVSKYSVQPFLATLFVGSILTGIRLVVTRSTPMGAVPEVIRFIGRGSTGPVPNALIVFVIVIAIAGIAMKKSVFAREVIAVGTNQKAALFSGINVDLTIIKTYCLSGISATGAAIVLSTYIGYADQWIGRGYEFDSLVAAVIGGNYLGGGRGSVAGAVGGVLVTSLILNVVILFRLEAHYQFIVKGAILVAATVVGSLIRRNQG